MSDPAPQSFASHRRLDPPYHVVLFGILVANLLAMGWIFVRILWRGAFDAAALWNLVMAAALLLLAFKVRLYALHNQDRLIRLEETLRLERVLPEALRPRIAELRPGHFIALRFAPDGELADLVKAALDEQLGREDLKRRIRSWRPDTFRV
jgi:hypothetical protein